MIRSLLPVLFSVGSLLGYEPPIGIPNPDFGGFDPLNDAAPGNPGSWPTAATAGYYYVDNTHGSATDTDNTYGYPDLPRLTIPTALSAGAVVVVGGTGAYDGLDLSGGVAGTEENPVWIRGASAAEGERPTIFWTGTAFDISDATHLYVENFDVDGNESGGGAVVRLFEDSNAILFRNIHASNYGNNCPSLGAGAFRVTLGSGWVEGEVNNNIVFYGCSLTNFGVLNWPPTIANGGCESGRQGFLIENGVDNVWILDCDLYEIGDDGVHILQVAGSSSIEDRRGPHGGRPAFIYIGDCSLVRCGENALDIKESEDVIASTNYMEHFRSTSSAYGWSGSTGPAVVINNEGEGNAGGDQSATRTWIINNTITDAVYGVYLESGGSSYILGNLIYDLVDAPNTAMSVWVDKAGAGGTNRQVEIHNNTSHNVTYGSRIIGTHIANYSNNIWGEINEDGNSGNNKHLRLGSANVTDFRNELTWDVTGGSKIQAITVTDLQSNQNPLWEDAASGDFQLTEGSPAIDNGSTQPAAFAEFETLYGLEIDVDITGRVRGADGTRDIGAFEYSVGGTATATSAEAGTLSVGE